MWDQGPELDNIVGNKWLWYIYEEIYHVTGATKIPNTTSVKFLAGPACDKKAVDLSFCHLSYIFTFNDPHRKICKADQK